MAFRYVLENKLDSATITVASEDANFPKTNLFDKLAGKTYRTTLKTGQWIKFYFSTALYRNLIAIINHNLTSGATIVLEANTTDAWITPALSVTLTWREKDLYKILTNTTAYQWWRLRVDDAGNSASYLEIGELIFGNYIELSSLFSYGWRTSELYPQIRHETKAGNIWSYKLSSRKRKTFQYPFEFLSDSERGEFETLFKDSFMAKPFLIIPDSSKSDCYYVWTAMMEIDYTENFYTNWAMTPLTLVEQPTGETI